jgi:hypothetical protein
MDITELSTQDILYGKDIDARIEELECGTGLSQLCPELTALREFRTEVTRYHGGPAEDWDKGLVNGDYWDTYAADVARNLYGDATECACWHDDEWADMLRNDTLSTDLSGNTFFYTG